LSILSRLFRRNRGNQSNLDYWVERASRYRERAVLNLAHGPEDYERVTARQRSLLFPLLANLRSGHERRVLDLGCGPGRFCPGLADLLDAEVVGVDPIEAFLRDAPRHPRVAYLRADATELPFEAKSFDIVWVCLVLGGLRVTELASAIDEIERVLADDGLLFLVENTSIKPDTAHWHFRSVGEYRSLFPDIALERAQSYDDLGEEISILAGRRKPVPVLQR